MSMYEYCVNKRSAPQLLDQINEPIAVAVGGLSH
jgi:hypothetical protein